MILLFAACLAITPGPCGLVEASEEAPSVILDPVPEYMGQNGFVFTGVATHDSSPIASVEYTCDYGPWFLAMPVDAPFGDSVAERFAFSIDALGDGAHLVQVRATTRAGHSTAPGDYATASFVLDTAPPSVTPPALVPDPTYDATPELVGSAEDSDFDELHEEFTVTLSDLHDGEHLVEVKAVDVAGNESSHASVEFALATDDDQATETPDTSSQAFQDVNDRQNKWKWWLTVVPVLGAVFLMLTAALIIRNKNRLRIDSQNSRASD